MKKRRRYPAFLVATLTVMTTPILSAQEKGSTQPASAPQAMPILKKMSNFLAAAERFSVTIHDGYDVVQGSGQKIEFGELRKITVSRPDRLRIEVERSDGQKGSVFDGKDITVYNAEEADKGYKIVEPPPGILITSLPKGAVTVTVNNVNYREFGGVWYQPFYSGSEIIYQTVPNPTG